MYCPGRKKEPFELKFMDAMGPINLIAQFYRFLSTDHLPPPFINKNILPSSILQSVLLPWSIGQNPSLANTFALEVAMALAE
jgi:hypothetical protein